MQPNQPHPHILSNDIIDVIKHNILISLHKLETTNEQEKELNQKIEEQYKKFTGIVFSTAERVRPLPVFLHSKPGMGKNAVFLAAAQSVCDELGLKLVKNPKQDYIPKNDDFIFFSFECSHSEDLNFVHASPDEIIERMEPITLTNKGFILFEEASEAGSDKKELINMVVSHPNIKAQVGMTGQVTEGGVQERKTNFVEIGAQHFILTHELQAALDKASPARP